MSRALIVVCGFLDVAQGLCKIASFGRFIPTFTTTFIEWHMLRTLNKMGRAE